MLITTEGEAHSHILSILARRRLVSAGNLTRTMMGMGLLANEPWSYTLIGEALRSLYAKGLVTKAGNGKSVYWRLYEAKR